MKNRIFQNIFLACMAVFLVSSGFILTVLFRHRPGATLLDLFTPLLAVLVLIIVLSLVLAAWLARRITQPLSRIDVQNPDERDIYEELRPLVQRISGQNRQLQQKVDELKVEHARQDAMRREFTANVSHELKTPLTSISGYAELIQGGVVKPEDVPRFAGTIYSEAQRLIVLVNDIIRLSRLEDQDVRQEQQTIDLLELCRETASYLEAAAQTRQVQLQVQGQSMTIHGVYQIAEEIVYNLCDNAIKYNKQGGTVTVTVSARGNRPVVEVRDTGIGIPQQEFGRVFERFYRVDKSHSKELGGTGLGLSIVKHGANYLNAELEIESEEQVGTAIRVIFPALQEA
ncbi:MAG: ATP-binding protein [Clostridia bacterium]|nr:ATP-binding protein [Clostridia bacterium]